MSRRKARCFRIFAWRTTSRSGFPAPSGGPACASPSFWRFAAPKLVRPAARDVYHQLVRQLSDRCDRIPSEETTALLDSLDAAPRVVVR